jgi:hypothetical protein
VHALVADGHHGRTDHIQDFVCQACGSRVSARWGTALYQLKTPPARISEVLSALAEGLSVGAAVRVFGHGEATITRWRDRAAQQAACVHRHFLHDLHLPHVQLDEIRTRLRLRERVLWLWLALDPQTKLVPALALGPRTQQSAHTLVHRLHGALAAWCTPVVTTDGLRLYFYALTAHFGCWLAPRRRRRWQVDPQLLYGQLHKRYRHRRLVRIRYQMGCGSRRAPGRVVHPGLEWASPNRLRGTPQPDSAPERRGAHPPHLGHCPDCRRPAAPGRVVACLLPLCPAPPQFAAAQAGLYPGHGGAAHHAAWTVAELLGYPCARAA